MRSFGSRVVAHETNGGDSLDSLSLARSSLPKTLHVAFTLPEALRSVRYALVLAKKEYQRRDISRRTKFSEIAATEHARVYTRFGNRNTIVIKIRVTWEGFVPS